jgi:hypothetical protein
MAIPFLNAFMLVVPVKELIFTSNIA